MTSYEFMQVYGALRTINSKQSYWLSAQSITTFNLHINIIIIKRDENDSFN